MAFTLLYNYITITQKGITTYQWLVQKVSIIEISLLVRDKNIFGKCGSRRFGTGHMRIFYNIIIPNNIMLLLFYDAIQ